jgi:hypothetical protein
MNNLIQEALSYKSQHAKTEYYKDYPKLYGVWNNIRQRCNNPNNIGFEYYGGKGIVVCELWDDFNKFKNWSFRNGFSEDKVLHRIDVDGDYEPDNCEWITDEEFRASRGKLGKVLKTIYQGREITLSELSRITGIGRETLKSRYLKGFQGDELIRKPHKYTKIKRGLLKEVM